MRFVLPPMRRPRHPLVRLLMAVVGLAVLGVFMIFGLLALAVLVTVGGAWLLVRQWKMARARPGSGQATESGKPGHGSRGNVLEGEFVVVHEGRHAPR